MKFIAKIDVMPRREELDAQSKIVADNLKNTNINGVEDVRIGKHIEMQLQANNDEEARNKVEKACEKLFSNILRETFSFTLKAI